jgi:hypothetical protein
VKGTLPEQFWIVHCKHPNPLANMPQLPVHPPNFSPSLWYTQERHNALDVNPEGFLWDKEVKLVEWLVKEQENAFIWEEAEKGRFDPEYFDPILLPTLDHIPWVFRIIPIPPGIYDKVLQIIWDKIVTGVYKDSNSSYQSRWFTVLKKDGKSLRIVHDLRPLNKISIRDSAVPP